ncbi:MAG: helix-turn-helix transcriptional regulator, partial [Dehalococcoidia bacterium]|nr:helix-turn-helix transcriptional regulator [Dehalococcoidia bacterium]
MTQRRRGRPRHPDILTPAEWRVLDELRAGGTNVEIAVRLGVSPDAVKFHISNMLAKLGLEDRQQLASWDRDSERGRLRALLAIPVALGSLARPLVWLGAGTAVLAGAAAIAVVLVVVPVSDEAVPVIPLATPTPISPTVGATSSPQPAPPST